MHQYDSDELLEVYLTALSTAFDPHTSYMSKHTLENFEIEMRLQLDGIGAALMAGDDGYTVVTKVVPGGAADKDGRLKADDKVIGVGPGPRADRRHCEHEALGRRAEDPRQPRHGRASRGHSQ